MIALMNIAERIATNNAPGADQVREAYVSVANKVGRDGICRGSLMTDQELDSAVALFAEKAKLLCS